MPKIRERGQRRSSDDQELFVVCRRIGDGPVERVHPAVPAAVANDMMTIACAWRNSVEVFWSERVKVGGGSVREETLSVATGQNRAESRRFVLDVKNPHGNQANLRVCALAGKRSVNG